MTGSKDSVHVVCVCVCVCVCACVRVYVCVCVCGDITKMAVWRPRGRLEIQQFQGDLQ